MAKDGGESDAKGYEIDRSDWRRGPWDDEPDRKQWWRAGLPCVAQRSPMLGNWCGYVGVYDSHPFYRMDHKVATYIPPDPLPSHRKLTYSGPAIGPLTEWQPRLWWFGFDCAHVGDQCPAYASRMARYEYRSLTYVVAICDQLADALAQFSP